MDKYLIIIILVSIGLISSLTLNIIQYMIYNANIDAYQLDLENWMEYASTLEDELMEWEVMVE